jgi:hypothetical protein
MLTNSFDTAMHSFFRHFLLCLLLWTSNSLLGQTIKPVTIKGYAPNYIGKEIVFSGISDYLTYSEVPLARSLVGADSSFTINVDIGYTQRLNLRIDKYSSFIYVDSAKSYTLYVPPPREDEAQLISGSRLDITFLNLDTSDINYKILYFENWCDRHLSDTYYMKNSKPTEFADAMKLFRDSVEKRYEADSSFFFHIFIRYTFATLDEMSSVKDRSRYAKYDFYLKDRPIFYESDVYMDYFNAFYDRMIARLDYQVSDSVSAAIYKSSPRKLMMALGKEYTLRNPHIRELVMIKALSEEFRIGYFPRKNILTILDSVSKGSRIYEHRLIARNVIDKLTQARQGAKAPEIPIVRSTGDTIELVKKYEGKHLYLHFYDPSSQKSKVELAPLIKLYENYKNEVNFVSLYPRKPYSEKDSVAFISSIPWEKIALPVNTDIMHLYKATTFPSYVLIDAAGYVVEAPALGPMPAGNYLTIDYTFFQLREALKRMKER